MTLTVSDFLTKEFIFMIYPHRHACTSGLLQSVSYYSYLPIPLGMDTEATSHPQRDSNQHPATYAVLQVYVRRSLGRRPSQDLRALAHLISSNIYRSPKRLFS